MALIVSEGSWAAHYMHSRWNCPDGCTVHSRRTDELTARNGRSQIPFGVELLSDRRLPSMVAGTAEEYETGLNEHNTLSGLPMDTSGTK